MKQHILGVEGWDFTKDGNKVRGAKLHTMTDAQEGENRKGIIPGQIKGPYEMLNQFTGPGEYEIYGSMDSKSVFKATKIVPVAAVK